MNKQQAQNLLKETFESPFEKGRFTGFVKNLLNQIEDASFTYQGNYIPDAYKPYISSLERIGKYSDDEHQIDILRVQLKKETSLERARTMQRNFIAWYLNGSRGGKMKDAALAAFVTPNEEDWRFSLVKMDYRFEKAQDGKVKVKEEFTPARRWSFLVGKNESSHTAQSRLVPILADDEHCPTLAQIEEAFNIEKVTKEFFGKYRELFLWTKETLDNVVKQDSKIKADFAAKGVHTIDFAKKLLGQIVFLYFLQKKGWFGVERDAEWGTGSKQFLRELFKGRHGKYQNFFNDILEPLFYEALRIDRRHDDDYYKYFNCKIPFLNGGLFDPLNNYDWVHTDILLPNKLFSNQTKTKEGDTGNGILDIFDRYNFTVKEDEPLEKEVAVDPEMLGKVFENLLEVKDRKSKGTYYTPREIVHYMCQQSLINYLYTELNKSTTAYQKIGEIQTDAFGNEAKVGQLDLTAEHKSPQITKEDLETLIKYGENVGENEAIVETKGKETKTYSYKLPESIRKHAKLIDEKLANIKVCDPAIGSGAFPVGMMHEIVKTRNVLTVYLDKGLQSLVTSSDRTIYNFKRECIENSLYGVDIDPGAVEIAKLRLWLSLVVDEEDIKQIKPLPNLDYKIVCGNSLLGVEKNLFNNELFSELERLKPLLFNETSPSKKQEYKKQIDDLISQITNGHKDFDFEVYFSEVFHENKGFDVVIANPPYVSVKEISSEDKKKFSIVFHTGQGRFNLFTLFLEKGHKLLRQHGVLTYILPEGLYSNVEYRFIREYLLDRSSVLFVNLFSNRVFEAAVDTSVISLTNDKRRNNIFPVFRDLKLASFELKQDDLLKLPFFIFPVNLTPSSKPIIDKLLQNNFVALENILEIQQGIIYSGLAKEKVFANEQINKSYKKVLDGRDILKWQINWRNKHDNKFIYYTDALHRPREERLFIAKEKIVIPRKATKIVAAYDNEQYYALNTAYLCLSKNNKFNLKYVLSFLNSKLVNYFYSSLFFGWQITIPALNMIPIPELAEDGQKPLIDNIDKILAITKDDDYLENSTKQAKVHEYEKQIDQLVYKLYGLTPEEIKIIEGSQT